MESRDDALLSEKLAALPLETPPAGAWGEIRARMQKLEARRAPRRASPWWLALAAGLAVVLVLPLSQQRPAPPTAAPQADAGLAALMQRSQSLEAQIRELRAASPDLADVQYEWESAIEDDLALVDVGLAANAHTEPLWRERVRLLEELRSAAQPNNAPLLLQARLD